MRTISVSRTGGSDVLELIETEIPEPGEGEVVVEVMAAGVNFIDVYHRTGLYPRELPFTPGQEGSGVVHSVGEGVRDLEPGARVAWAPFTGSYAEYAVIPAGRLVAFDEKISFEIAAACMLQGMTAHYLAHDTVHLHHGDRALVHAGAGGVGLLLVQMLKRLRVTVFATTSTEEKAELVREAGADEVILYTETDFAEEIGKLSESEGVEVVYDSVGKTTFSDSLASLATRGMLVSFGQSSGPVAPFELGSLSRGSFYLTRPSLGHYVETTEQLRHRAGEVLGMVAGGALDVRIDSRYPLEQAAGAHDRIESRASSGKIVLVVRD